MVQNWHISIIIWFVVFISGAKLICINYNLACVLHIWCKLTYKRIKYNLACVLHIWIKIDIYQLQSGLCTPYLVQNWHKSNIIWLVFSESGVKLTYTFIKYNFACFLHIWFKIDIYQVQFGLCCPYLVQNWHISNIIWLVFSKSGVKLTYTRIKYNLACFLHIWCKSDIYQVKMGLCSPYLVQNWHIWNVINLCSPYLVQKWHTSSTIWLAFFTSGTKIDIYQVQFRLCSPHMVKTDKYTCQV